MFDFLFEGSLVVYGLLFLFTVFLLYHYQQDQKRNYLKALLVVAAMAFFFFLLDILRDTDKEKALKLLDEVTVLINAGKYDQAFSHLADDFRAYDIDRKNMRDAAERSLERFAVRDITLKSKSIEKEDKDRRMVTIRFNSTAESNLSTGWAMAPCEVDFIVDAQGRCRIKSFRVYQPFVDSMTPWNPFSP